ncbi:MAG: YwiC-like family protein [Candidatus Omnitrophota bacterium]
MDCKNKQEIRSALGAFYSAVPKQHGAWIVLIACFIIGSCAGVRFGLESVILLVSVIAAFLARAALGLGLSLPGEEKERKGLIAWVMFYSGMLLVSGIWLVAGYKLWILGLMGIIGLGLAAFSLVLEKVKKDMTLSGQIINIIGLSLTAPAAEYCASGSYSPNTLGVWLVCVLFFLGSVFYVRFLVRRRLEVAGKFGQRLRAGFTSLVFHLSALLAVTALSKFRVIPLSAPLALVPAASKALWPIIRRSRNSYPVKHIGRLELIHTLVFSIITVLVFTD